ncbi:MAG: MFS transporter [Chthonomonadaceae bacterium]|nr:MFS transporter [Chthonomonadaceae bacterium]
MNEIPAVSVSETRSAPRPLNRLEVLRGLQVAIREGCSSTIWSSLTTNIFLTGFALWLGASPFLIGLLTAIPTFAGLIQVVSSFFSDRLPQRKPFIALFSVVGRTLWLPILLLPFFFSKETSLALFLPLYALSHLCLNIPTPAYMAWMSDLVPADHRGRYFGRRNMIMGFVGMAVGLPAAWFLDLMLKGRNQGAVGFAVLFGVGVIGGWVAFYFLGKQPEPPLTHSQTSRPTGWRGAWEYYRTPFEDKNFVRLMGFSVVFGMGQFFAMPFFNVYALQRLRLDYTSLQIFSTVTAIMSLLTMPLWGGLADRFGNKPLLAIGAVGVVPIPIYWALTSPTKPALALFLLQLINVQSGIFWAGVGLTQFNLLIRSAPPEKTPIYAATMAAVTGLTGGLAPLLGGATMKAFENSTFHIYRFTLDNYRITFLVAALLRFAGLFFLRKIRDGESASARTVLQELRNARPRTWVNLRRLQRGGGELERLRATEFLAESKTRLATGELEWALHDPSSAVRSEAARALGQIGDKSSVEALLEVIRDPASGIVPEAAYSLAQLKDVRALPHLLTLAYDKDHSLLDRRAVVVSLGRMGNPLAASPLLTLLQNSLLEDSPLSTPEFKTALVEAITALDATIAAPTFLQLLKNTPSPPLKRACIRGLGETGDPAFISDLMAILPEALGDSALAVALAEALTDLKATEALLPLYRSLSSLESPLARVQVAHSLGVLIGQGETAYLLLSKEPFAGDGDISALVREMQRGKSDAVSESLGNVLSAFIEREYAASVRLAGSLAPLESPFVALRLLQEVPPEPVRETVILAFLVLRQVGVKR